MKKIIVLLLVLLMSACSAVKPSETLSSMQNRADNRYGDGSLGGNGGDRSKGN